MRICHVITRMIVGGAQENTLLSVTGGTARGHEVTLVTGPSPGREGNLLTKTGGLPDFELVEMPDLIRNISPFRDLRAYYALKRFFASRKFDVVHTHSSKAGIIGRLAARAAGVPVVVHTVHGQAFSSYARGFKDRFYIAAERIAAARCDRIFAVAQAMIDQCVAYGIAPRGKYRVVYSGMETARFAGSERDAALRESLGISGNVRVIATLARLFPQKGYEYVIPAAAEIMRRFPDVRLLIIGDGPMYEQLSSDIARLGMAGKVFFAGLIPPGEVHRYLSQADLLWHLSLREGLPRSVVQALASGIPAVGFRLDGTPEVILDGRTGYCVEPCDVSGVVERTAELLSDPAAMRAMGENGRAMVVEMFDSRRMCDILEREYAELLNLKSGRAGR